MIEKINFDNSTIIDAVCAHRINEIIDELNHILEERELGIKVYEEVMPNMKPTDQFAEQRKWIGKLCKFWDCVYDHYYFDTLKGITDKGLFIGHNGSWEHCEPVKPDDDMIYKGE